MDSTKLDDLDSAGWKEQTDRQDGNKNEREEGRKREKKRIRS
jgi:hypothetical protein